MLERYDNPNSQMSVKANTVLKVLKTGSGLNIVDILVRESIQNSLDAYNKDENCNVIFLIDYLKYKNGNDLSDSLKRILADKNTKNDRLFNRLCERIKLGDNSILILSDRGTTGLSGPIRRDDPDWNNKENRKNFDNLVYELGQNHGADMAGGSFGFGKSIYYNLSDSGLVMYYSRTKERELLSFCMISTAEIDNNPDSTGISWWGETYKYNNITYASPITDSSKISVILNILNIKSIRLTEGQTGTSVCIFAPKLNDVYDDDHIKDPIQKIGNSAIKWFWPRMTLSPKVYNKGIIRPLEIFINGNKLEISNQFKLLQEIFLTTENQTKCIGEINNIKLESITYNNNLIGTLAYKKFKNYLPPDSVKDFPFNRIAMMRGPRMIVYYKDDFLVNSEEYLIQGLFIVNSELEVFKNEDDKSKNIKSILDNAFKESESSTHSEWKVENISENNKYFRAYVNKVHNDSKKILNNIFNDTEIIATPNLITSQLSSTLGKLLGIESSNISSISFKGNTFYNNRKSANFKLPQPKLISQKFISKKEIELRFAFNNLIKGSEYKFSINAKGSNTIMSYENWSNKIGKEFPFQITDVSCASNFNVTRKETYCFYFKVLEKIGPDDSIILKINVIKNDAKLSFTLLKI